MGNPEPLEVPGYADFIDPQAQLAAEHACVFIQESIRVGLHQVTQNVDLPPVEFASSSSALRWLAYVAVLLEIRHDPVDRGPGQQERGANEGHRLTGVLVVHDEPADTL